MKLETLNDKTISTPRNINAIL